MINSISIVSIAIISVFGGPGPAHAQSDPPIPSGACTNDCPTNNPVNYTWPTNGLVWSIAGSNQFALHTLVPNFLYEIEGSSDLLNWTLLKGPFTNGLTNSFSIETTNSQMFFRAHQVMFQTNWATPVVSAGSGPCGSWSGLAAYIPTTTNWFPVDERTVLHTFADGAGNHTMSYGGRFGDTGCATGFGTITNPPSWGYRFTIYFTGTVPTNPYPLVLSGFTTNN